MTKIPYLNKTWNFIGGCSPCGAGCLHCWACRQAAGRLKNHPLYEGLTKDGKWTGKIRLCADIDREDLLEKPLHWREPRIIGVQFMGDLFHEAVPFEFIDKVFAVMASSSQHIFLVLTKRPDRMKRWFSRAKDKGPMHANMHQSALIDYYSRHGVDLSQPYQVPAKHTPELAFIYDSAGGTKPEDKIEDRHTIYINKTELGQFVWRKWPLSNVHLGVSISTQKEADEKIPIGLQIPGFDWVSVEPMLEDVFLFDEWLEKLSYVIIGAESIGGSCGRPCDINAARRLVQQCDGRVKIHVKQLHIDGKLVKDVKKFPRDLRRREQL